MCTMHCTGEKEVDDDQHEEAEDVQSEAAVLLVLETYYKLLGTYVR